LISSDFHIGVPVLAFAYQYSLPDATYITGFSPRLNITILVGEPLIKGSTGAVSEEIIKKIGS
jgi:hypothetical protein